MSALLDVDALIASAAEQVAARIVAQLPSLFRAELERRAEDRMLTMAHAAEFLGRSRAGFERWLTRPQGAEARALATFVGGKRMWRRSDLEALVARGSQAR